MLEYVDLLCTQDMGSKEYCIGMIRDKGYKNSNVLMCGDAVGDMKAAQNNGVLYYSINVNHEDESWSNLMEEGMDRFLSGSYEGAFQEQVIQKFLDNLK